MLPVIKFLYQQN